MERIRGADAIKVKTPKTYTKTFFTNCILKNNSVKTAFYTTVKNLRGEYKNNGKHKGSWWKLIIFSSKVINFTDFTQTSTITKLLIKWIKVQIWLAQCLGSNVQSSQLSTINRRTRWQQLFNNLWLSFVKDKNKFMSIIILLHVKSSYILKSI